jgi:type II secretory pathway pseudopilin PulG
LKKTARNGNLGRRRGFSLLIVLVIAIIGLAVVGVTVQMTTTSSGAGRMASATNVKYNFLQHAVEEGKAALKEKMDNEDDPPRFVGYDTTPTITAADELLIDEDFGIGEDPGIVKNTTLTKAQLGRLGIAGDSGTLVVKIYDMGYDPKKVSPGSDDELKKIPPSIIIAKDQWNNRGEEGEILSESSLNVGAYLVRASLRVGDSETVLDSAIMQANSKP